MNTIKQFFKIILSGSKEQSRCATRQIRKLVYSSQGGKEKYQDIKIKNCQSNQLSAEILSII